MEEELLRQVEEEKEAITHIWHKNRRTLVHSEKGERSSKTGNGGIRQSHWDE